MLVVCSHTHIHTASQM